ncbi:MAG: transposase [Acidobacteria bacterium]|nr:transposase [Acidobacteriota bacterium]MBI3655515.1 transposase [Acidobacteriota bacterium]
MESLYKTYTHAPTHYFSSHAVYMVTAGALHREHFIGSDQKKQCVLNDIRHEIERYKWELVAWVILSNHYHMLLRAPEKAATLIRLIKNIHTYSAGKLNKLDDSPSRQVWWNYWDTCITNDRSFYARLNYIHWNPVKHGVVRRPEQYRFSSYNDYYAVDAARTAELEGDYPFDRVQVFDEF